MRELAIIGANNVFVYFDGLKVHAKTYSDHMTVLEKFFLSLGKCNLKLNPFKFHLGTQTVDYLGFGLTPQGILPGIQKFKCSCEAPPLSL